LAVVAALEEIMNYCSVTCGFAFSSAFRKDVRFSRWVFVNPIGHCEMSLAALLHNIMLGLVIPFLPLS